MSSEVVVSDINEQKDLVKESLLKSLFPNLKEEEAIASYQWAKKRGLSIEARQCYPLKLGGKVQMFPSIDGVRVIAEKTGKYAGSGDAKLLVRLHDGTKQIVSHELYDPSEVKEIISATISVYRKDFSNPLTATAVFNGYVKKDFNGKPQNLWASMPDVMLLKCAESLALRKCFPEVLSGLYTVEEMEQATNNEPRVYATAKTPERKVVSLVSSPAEERDNEVVDVEATVEPHVWEKFVSSVSQRSAEPEVFLNFAEKTVCEKFEKESPLDIEDGEVLRDFLKTIWTQGIEKGLV